MESYRQYMQSEIAKIEQYPFWIDEPMGDRLARYTTVGKLNDNQPYKFTPIQHPPSLFESFMRFIDMLFELKRIPDEIQHRGYVYRRVNRK
jgi:hypothetical protein